MSETSRLFDKIERQTGFDYIDQGPRIYEFEQHQNLANFLHDAVINCLVDSVQIDYRNTWAMVIPAAPGIDRLDDAALRNQGQRLKLVE